MKKSFLLFFAAVCIFAGIFVSCSPSISKNPEKSDPIEEVDNEDNFTVYAMLENYDWNATGVNSGLIPEEPTLAQWAQYKRALADVHGEVYALSTNLNQQKFGTSSLVFDNVTVSTASAVTFDYKLDLYKDDFFYIYVDGREVFRVTGYEEVWKKSSVLISEGSHKIEFSVKRTSNYYSLSLTNAVYLDNIHLVADRTESLEISPKGKQETYVGGFPIQFKANALRADDSIREGQSVVWSCTGGTITRNGLFTPGSNAGNCSVTATINGKKVVKTDVVVHGKNYLSDSVTLNDHTFTGYKGETGSRSNSTFKITEAPVESSFSADGFFVIKGTVNNPDFDNYAIISVKSGDYSYYTMVQGDFYERIWLRFGTKDTYTVSVSKITKYQKRGEVFILWGWTTTDQVSFTVTNTHQMEDAVYLMPSPLCQSDNFLISNIVNDITGTLPSNATTGQKMQALYDWELHLLHYDFSSTVNNGVNRKLQDAYSVVKNKMAVCEGYANLYASLVRSFGVKTRYMSSREMNHGWVECQYNNNWRLVDATWDDPATSSSPDNVEKYPDRQQYRYFLINNSGIDNDHYGYITEADRSIESKPVAADRMYYFDGWY